MSSNRRFKLVRRPQGMPVDADFTLVTEATKALTPGQFLLRNHYASLDPAMRGWMDDRPSYVPPMVLNEPVRASTVGVVVESLNPDFPVGTWATGMLGIEDYSLCEPRGVTAIDPEAMPSVTNYLSLLGLIEI